MARAFLFVLDSFGVGGAPDAARFGDEGANTFGHIARACFEGKADSTTRQGALNVPNMAALGLAKACKQASGFDAPGFDLESAPEGIWGSAKEISNGKDTPSGHWEMAGTPVLFDWGYFPDTVPSFPAPIIEALIREAGIPGILGDKHASGTEIIDELGEEHIKTGKPICYTSIDSVFQIAAHEEHFGLERLYALCEVARKLLDPLTIGRVIARPFIGDAPGNFERTGNRRDYSVKPPAPTLLDRLKEAGRNVVSVGKISDIFAHQGITEKRKATGNMALFDEALKAMHAAKDGDLVFANFVDFDSLYGHRRNVSGYAEALEAFDHRLLEAYACMREGDVLILTADHGCDPTWKGSNHTREQVPILIHAPGKAPRNIGSRDSFADIGACIADLLGVEQGPYGKSFWTKGA